MQIACVTEDGRTISAHFGRAPTYLVFTVENDRIVARQERDKLGHRALQEGDAPARGGQSAEYPVSRDRHARMAATIADCQVLLCGGMGYGAYESLCAAGVTPLITDVLDAEEAVRLYLAGRLQDHPERLH